MPQEILITDIVDVAGNQKDLNDLIAHINQVEKAIQHVNKQNISFGNVSGLTELKRATEQLTAATDRLEKVVNQSVKTTKAEAQASLAAAKAKTEEAKQSELAAKAKLNEAKAANENAKAKKGETQEKEKAEKASAREAKAAKDALNDYVLLSKAYNDAALKAKTYFLTLGESSPITIEAIQNAKDLKAILDKVDQATGDYRRNVGNYSSAFSGLGNSFQQLARELPSLAINAQTFFLAISNNIPIFIDQMRAAKIELAALKAQGEQVPSLFQQLTKSIFSWGTALSIGVTLLTVFGGKIVDWVSGLFSGKSATEKLTESIEKLNVKFKELDRNTDTQIRKLKESNELLIIQAKLRGASEAEISKIIASGYEDEAAELQKATNVKINEIRKLASSYYLPLRSAEDATRLLNQIESDLANNDYTKLYKTRLEEAATKLKELIPQLQQVEDSVANANKERLNFEAENAEAIRKALSERDIANIEDDLDIAMRNAQAVYEMNKRALEDAIEFEKAFADLNIDGSVDARIRQFEEEKKLIQLELDYELNQEKLKIKAINKIRAEELSQPGLSEADIIAINARADSEIKSVAKTEKEKQLIIEKANREIVEAESRMALDIIKIRSKINEDLQNEVKRGVELAEIELQKYIDSEKKIANSIEAIAIRTANERLTALNKEFAAGKISKDKYEQEKLRIEQEALKKSLQAQIDYYKYLTTLYNLDADAKAEALNKIAELEKKLSEVGVTNQNDDIARLNERKEALKQLSLELQGLVVDLFQGGITREKNEIQEQIDLLEQKKQKDIEVANQTIQNAQERAAAIATIEARANAQRELLEQRKRQLDLQNARFERARAVGAIIQNTAIAITRVLPNVVLAAIIGAIGAAQLIRTLATPLPRFFKGKNWNAKDSYEGPAWVDDGGKPEAIIREDGRVEIGGDQPRITYLKAKDIVVPDARLLAWNATHTADTKVVQFDGTGEIVAGLNRLDKRLLKIQNKQDPHYNVPGIIDIWLKSNKNWEQFNG